MSQKVLFVCDGCKGQVSQMKRGWFTFSTLSVITEAFDSGGYSTHKFTGADLHFCCSECFADYVKGKEAQALNEETTV